MPDPNPRDYGLDVSSNPILSFRQARAFRNDTRDAAVIKEDMKNYLNDPTSTIKAVNQIDPYTGLALNAQHTSEVQAKAAQEQATQKRKMDSFSQFTGFLRDAKSKGVTDFTAAIGSMSPFLKSNLGMDDNSINEALTAVNANPGLIDQFDEEGRKAALKLASTTNVTSPGSDYWVGGKFMGHTPALDKIVQVTNNSGGRDVISVNPQSGGGGAITGPTRGGWSPRFSAGGDNSDAAVDGKLKTLSGLTGLGLDDPIPDGMVNSVVTAIAKSEGRAAGKNNPTNIKNRDGNGFQQFASLDAGNAAAAGLVRRKIASGQTTLRTLIEGLPTGGGGGAGPTVKPIYHTEGKPAADKSVRPATPQELAAAGMPEGTGAQVENATGKFVNLKMPGKGKAATVADAKTLSMARDTAATLERLGVAADELARSSALAGATGNIYGRVPAGLLGQSAVDFVNKLTNLKGNVGLSALQSFKAMSKTGASGFGNLSDKEGARLDGLLGTLDRTSSPVDLSKTFRAIAKFVREHNTDLKGGIGSFSQGAAPAASAPPRRAVNLKTGAAVIWNGRGWVPEKK